MTIFWDALQTHAFLQYALAAGFLVSIPCGVVGSFVVIRRISYIAGGIAHSVLAGLGMKILSDKQEVETLLHEVFLQVWQNAGSYDPNHGNVKTWLSLQMCSRGLQISGLESTAGASA